MPHPHLVYVADPMCSWCWGFSPVIDAIRERFGSTSIGPASAVSARGLRLARKGAQQWGPDHDVES